MNLSDLQDLAKAAVGKIPANHHKNFHLYRKQMKDELIEEATGKQLVGTDQIILRDLVTEELKQHAK